SDHINSLIEERVVSDIRCIIFGAGTTFFINTQAFWIAATSVYTYLLIVWKIKLSFGFYEWKLHLFCWGIPLVILILSLIFDQYRADV
ncbi:hypothetical protein HK099_002681, partial [Clydaea vesicula]